MRFRDQTTLFVFINLSIDSYSAILYNAYMKKKLTHARTCVYNCNYHIIWTVKYRRKVLTADIEARLKKIVFWTASNCDFVVHEVEVGERDHVHIFASAHPKVSASYIVRSLKSSTGQLLLKEFPSLHDNLWGGHLWSPSYYVETIGSVNEDAIHQYLQEQDKEPGYDGRCKKYKALRKTE